MREGDCGEAGAVQSECQPWSMQWALLRVARVKSLSRAAADSTGWTLPQGVTPVDEGGMDV